MENEANGKQCHPAEAPQQPFSQVNGEHQNTAAPNGSPSRASPESPVHNQVSVHLVDVKEMATILGVKVSWLYQRTRLGTGVIPFVRFGKYLRFEPEKVIEYYRSQSR